MKKRIFYVAVDGSPRLVIPAPDNRQRSDETDDEFAERIRDKDVPVDATSVRIVDVDSLPEDMTSLKVGPMFFEAWVLQGEAITIDMPKARDIWRDRIRQARAPLLAALDVEYQRADERGDTATKAEISARKQSLRDAPARPDIQGAKTPEDLKKVWPLL